jgi:hypothetical protein
METDCSSSQITIRKTAGSDYFAVRILYMAHDVTAFAIVIYAAVGLGALPKLDPGIFTCFFPPIIAFVFLMVNTWRKLNTTFVAGCRLFLGTIATSVFLSHFTFVLPNLKPRFPGLPPQQDRVLCFYLATYGMFLWCFCPAYVLGNLLYRDFKGISPRMSTPILYASLTCWLFFMAFGVIRFVIRNFDNIF